MIYAAIYELLKNTIGLDADTIGKKNIKYAINSRMESLSLQDIRVYFETMQKKPGELDQLIEKVIIPETWFFRDVEPFIFLQKYIENSWLPAKQTQALRVLSIPCSTGEEPYSIAMTLLETGMSSPQIHIDAADISKNGLETARLAVYGKRSFRGKGVEYQSRYYRETDNGSIIDPQVSGLVHFHYDNVVKPSFLKSQKPYHIIFCRNLMIYLTEDARKKVFDNLDQLLVPEGILFTGHSELLLLHHFGYTMVKHPRSFACQKIQVNIRSAVPNIRKKIRCKKKRMIHQPVKFSHTSIENTPKPAKNIQEKTDTVLSSIRSLADRGELKEAFVLCNKVLKEKNPTAEVFFLMGLISSELNEPEKAEEYFNKALYLDPFHYETIIHFSLLYEHIGDMAKSMLFKERAQRLYNNSKKTVRTLV
ncbi:MAG: chemotaxis protein [Candidatus Latescibacteria bacterium]|nr:chemotaxis protein [Candidatus Latescibacterota bacterium]